MKKVRLLTPWTGDGQSISTAYRPAIVVDYPDINCQDLSGCTPPVGNFLVEIECDDEALTAIQADPKYTVIS